VDLVLLLPEIGVSLAVVEPVALVKMEVQVLPELVALVCKIQLMEIIMEQVAVDVLVIEQDQLGVLAVVELVVEYLVQQVLIKQMQQQELLARVAVLVVEN
jgi:hypothetical protein